VTLARTRRRVFAGAAAVGLGLLVIAPRAFADDTTPSANFAGSKLTTPASSSSTTFSVTSEWHHVGGGGSWTFMTFVTAPSNPSGCLAPGEAQIATTAQPVTPDGQTTSAAVDVVCNGVYQYRVHAHFANLFTDDDELSSRITIAEPPPSVTKVKATPSEDGSSVAISWTEPSNLPPDVSDYKIQRVVGSGAPTDIGTVQTGHHTFTDKSLPAGQTQITYVVYVERPSPNGTLLSPSGGKVTAQIPSGTTSTTAPGGGTGGTTGGGTAGTGGTGGTTGGGTGGTAGTGGTGGGTGGTGGKPRTITNFAPLNRGDTGVGVAAPNLGRPSSDLSTSGLAGENDEGSYSSQLPYGQDSGDGLGSSDREDGLSSATYENGSGRGMAVPIAVGFVFAAWAFHLRFLAKASRPTARVAPRHGPA